MAPHFSTLAWKIPWTEEPGRLQSMGLRRVGHDQATSLSLFTFMHWRRKQQPTPVFLPGESQGQGSLVGCRLWGRTELDTTDVTQQQQQPLLQIFNLCFLVFVINFVPLRIQFSVPIFTQECDYWLDCPLPLLTLFHPQVTSISSLSPSLLYSTLNFFGYSGLWRTLRELITGQACLSLLTPSLLILFTSISLLPLLFSI